MKPLSKAARFALVRLLAVAGCSLAAGPLVFLLEFFVDAIEGASVTYAAARLRHSPDSLLFKFAAISIMVLPATTLIASGIHVLGRMRKDSFFFATLSGSMLGSIALYVTALSLIGQWPGLRFLNIRGATAIIGLSILLSALYWVVAIRGHRRMRALVEQDAWAIRAME
ncbi:hypothetical protein [Dongia deserti]|uniref:hypothetical protein n=1 Tax=Dongia deserti TaxID=2268030 RepID=UPI000E64C0A4|nr:hypothetical protein [Dongia deserti]